MLTVCLLTACGLFDIAGPLEATATVPSPTLAPTLGAPRPSAVPPPVTTVVVTTDGAVWYAYGQLTWPTQGGGGVKRLADGRTTSFGLADGLPHEHVQLLKVAPDGMLWAAAERHLARFDGQAWQKIGCVGEHTRSIILDLAFAPDGTVWVASPFALVRTDGQTCGVDNRMTRALASAPDGTLWASGWEGAEGSWYAGSWDGTTWTTFNTIELFDESVSRLVVTFDGLVWGATAYHGVVSFDGHEWTEHTTEDGLPSNRILELALAPESALWALTDRGIARFDGQVWVKEADVPATARAMAVGPDGAVWLATATSLERIEWPLAEPTGTSTIVQTLTVAKWADKEQASVGEVLTYTLVVMNDMLGGEDPGTNVQLLDTLPETLELVPSSLSPEATYDDANRTVRWGGTVPQGGSMEITFRVVLTPAAGEMRSVINTVAVTDAFGRVTERSAQTQVVN
jgi:uncharacterized repeat protein (TIGR01451 family)